MNHLSRKRLSNRYWLDIDPTLSCCFTLATSSGWYWPDYSNVTAECSRLQSWVGHSVSACQVCGIWLFQWQPAPARILNFDVSRWAVVTILTLWNVHMPKTKTIIMITKQCLFSINFIWAVHIIIPTCKITVKVLFTFCILKHGLICSWNEMLSLDAYWFIIYI